MPYVVRLDDLPPIIPEGHQKTENRILFEDKGQGFAMWIGDLRPGGGADIHSHDYPQAFYVIEGQGEIEIDGKRWPISKGTGYYAPAGISHGVTQVGAGGLKVLVFSFNRQARPFSGG